MTSLDFAGTPKPDGKLRSAVLIQGTGATVKKGQTITVNYLGQVYKGKKPFDESYSKQPASFAIGTGAVISGWDKTLVGQKVGSRVILAIPPEGGLRQEGPADRGHQGHRHAVLRGRHPRRLLSTMGAMSSRSPR